MAMYAVVIQERGFLQRVAFTGPGVYDCTDVDVFCIDKGVGCTSWLLIVEPVMLCGSV